MADDYTEISNPYDSNLARAADTLSLTLGGDTVVGVAQQSQNSAQPGGNTAASSSVAGGPAQQTSVGSGGALADIVIKNSIQSSNWSPKKVGFYIDGQTGYAEFSNVFVSGNIRALTGTVGGWTINATTLTGGSATLDSAGVLSLGTGNDIAKMSAADATYRLWIGHATAASAPFSVTKAGAVSASNMTITGGSININNAATIDSSGNMVVNSLERDDYHWFTTFESIDGYAKAGVGTQTLNPDHVELATTAGANSESQLQKDALYSRSAFSWDKRRKIKFGVRFDQNTSQYIDMLTGQVTYGSNSKHFGFNVTDGTLYGITDDGSGQTQKTLVASIATNVDYELEAVFTPGVSVGFYVNGSLIDTSTTNLPSGSTSEAAFLLDFYIRATSASLRSFLFSYYDFWQQN